MDITAFHLLAIAAIALLAALLSVVLFEPGLAYRIHGELPPCASHESRGLIAALVDSAVMPAMELEVLTDGQAFYPAQLRAIEEARHSIHLEAFVFHRSAIADRLLAAMAARARGGVKVRLIIDAIGSLPTPDSYFADLRRAGAEVAWYQPVRWHTLKRFNNRTHRELLVIDGATGFIGGAGVAAWWDDGGRTGAPWRDTMVCVHGPLASALQSSFAENWLESTGELLTMQQDFPFCRALLEPSAPAAAHGLVVTSAPSAGKATRARMLFQVLLASARRSISIASPYFLPDRSVLRELGAAVQRGVNVRIIVPGVLNNHPIARRASRRRYGALLRAGVQLHEYQPAMMHAKIMVVDQVWSVVGSTNFDNRSFGLNDEVNLAVQDPSLARRLEQAFESDLACCVNVSAALWRRSRWERVLAGAGALLERHQ
ncbi:MAG: hypothetical protein KIT60_20185 [Burkholderiaceae bacterium]|nr:hypothetical protein [Burkholderiaceae bacterium]